MINELPVILKKPRFLRQINRGYLYCGGYDSVDPWQDAITDAERADRLMAIHHVEPWRHQQHALALFLGENISRIGLFARQPVIDAAAIDQINTDVQPTAGNQLEFDYFYFGQITRINPLSVAISDLEKHYRIMAIYHQTGNFRELAHESMSARGFELVLPEIIPPMAMGQLFSLFSVAEHNQAANAAGLQANENELHY